MKGAPPVLEIATDYERRGAAGSKGSSEQIEIGEEARRKLGEISRQEGATMYMSLLAGIGVMLSRHSGQEEVVVGTVIANRNRAEVEGLIGYFANTLAMRVKVREEESYREMVRRVKEVGLGAYANQDLPFEKLVEELQPERDLTRSP